MCPQTSLFLNVYGKAQALEYLKQSWQRIKTGAIAPANIKAYEIATAMNTTWYWLKDGHISQCNRRWNPEINPHRYTQISFGKTKSMAEE